MLYSEVEQCADFAGLEFIVLEELETELSEGAYHTGSAAVARLLARKPVQEG